MKKRILSMILAIAMIASVFAGIAVTASAAEGTYVRADSVAAGDIVIMANPDGTSVFTEITSNNIGSRADATPNGDVLVSAEAAQLTVEAGATEGSIALKMADGMYIGWSSGNTIKAMEAVGEAASWIYSVDENGKASLVCVKLDGEKERKLQYNSSSPRFCAYTSNQAGIALFKLTEGDVCTHTEATSEVITPATCTEAGVEKFTCSNAECGFTWEAEIPATGHTNDEGVVTTAATCTEDGVITFTCTVCGSTKEGAIPATGHDFVDGTCSVCGAAKGETVNYSLIDLETIVEGNYVITAVLGGEYPTVYPATSKLTTGSNADWGVSSTAVVAVEDVITSDDLPEDAQVFTFKGNNTDGFTISFEADGVTKYLGYTGISANRKLAFAEDYATTLWTVVADSDGGFALSSAYDGGNVVISQNSTTASSAIRGYKSGAIYTGLYIFADAKGEVAPECQHTNTSEIAAVEATCTTDGNAAGVKCEDCGEVISGGEVIPATGHDKAVTVVEGTIKTVCANCGESEELALNTIAEAKAYTDSTVVYNIKGIVTYASGRNVYIQDEDAGLCVYFAYDFDTSDINLGDEIFVSSTMTTYKGLIELNLPKEYFVLSTGHAVEVQIVDLATLAADTANEYLGEKVFIEKAVITEIATNGSVTLEQNGTTIIIYKAPALTEDCVVGATVNVTAVVSTYNGYQLLIRDAADVVMVPGEEPCAHTNITVLEAVAATCTETGLTEGAKCADCGEITVAQEVIPALGHANTTAPNGDGTHTTTCGNCGEATTGDCEYVDGVCSVCGAEEPSTEPVELPDVRLNHTLNLASDISISYAVLQTVVAGYDRFYVEAVVPTYSGNEKTGSYTVTVEATPVDMFYYFTLKGITAVQMNDIIEARLYMVKGEEIYMSTLDTYSVGTYAYSQLNKTAASAELKALCADLLRYGSYAQIFKAYRTDALVNANMTDAMKAYLSDMEGVTFNNNKADLGDFENPSIKWMGRVLNLDSKVEVKFVFTVTDPSINVEDLSAKITYVNYKGETVTVTVNNAEVYNEAMGYYAFSFDSLLAAELRAVMNTVVYNGDTRVSTTSTYSVDTYGNGKTGALLDVCKAMIAYSDTALAYFN